MHKAENRPHKRGAMFENVTRPAHRRNDELKTKRAVVEACLRTLLHIRWRSDLGHTV